MMMLAASITACVEEDPTDDSNIVVVGDALPQFSVSTAEGAVVSSDSLAGHRSVVVFFNTSCSDCREELPRVDSLYQAMTTAADFRLICIAREESKESIARFWNEKGLTMPYAPQQDRNVYSLFARSIIPRIYICSADGVVRFMYGDSYMPSFAELMNSINAL